MSRDAILSAEEREQLRGEIMASLARAFADIEDGFDIAIELAKAHDRINRLAASHAELEGRIDNAMSRAARKRDPALSALIAEIDALPADHGERCGCDRCIERTLVAALKEAETARELARISAGVDMRMARDAEDDRDDLRTLVADLAKWTREARDILARVTSRCVASCNQACLAEPAASRAGDLLARADAITNGPRA